MYMDSYIGCEHYKRKCTIIAPCCNEEFACRLCHYKVKYDNERDPKKAHQIDRKLITTIICQNCKEKQPVQNKCRKCNITFAAYFCNICNLFDDDGESKQIFHCDKCNICRVGGRENFFHCDKCNMCISNQVKNTHKCVDNSMHQNCPVCQEYLFDSRQSPYIMECGHTIHLDCFNSLLKSNHWKCPVCSMSLIEMTSVYDNLRNEISLTPMPDEYKDKMVKILCNDCHNETDTPFHVVGLECKYSNCRSFNTKQI